MLAAGPKCDFCGQPPYFGCDYLREKKAAAVTPYTRPIGEWVICEASMCPTCTTRKAVQVGRGFCAAYYCPDHSK